MLQAQRALQPHRWLTGACSCLPRPRHLSCRGAQWSDFDQRRRMPAVPAPARKSPTNSALSAIRNVATFIKELVLEPVELRRKSPSLRAIICSLTFPPTMRSRSVRSTFPSPLLRSGKVSTFSILSLAILLEAPRRNNYSVASNQQDGETHCALTSALPRLLPGQDCDPGIGSSYFFSLKPGDIVSGIGPFGDFHIKPTQREMVYIGGGAGMAPLRAHLSHLLETEQTARKISFWYGARSKQEIFYEDYFRDLAAAHHNFTFHLALSSPLPEDDWTGHLGFIHEVVLRRLFE